MKKLFLNLLFLTSTFYCFAQNESKQFKISFSGVNKKVHILSGSNSLTIEGYAGTEVIIEATDNNKELPEEAEGLRIISAGAIDNTGLSANVTLEENALKIKIPKSKYFSNFKLKIPKDLALSIKESGNNYGKWNISGMSDEIEVNTTYSTVNIKNVSGPLMARCGYGKITVVYDQVNPKKPNSISASGAVDVTLPSETKANLKLVSSYGDVFSDFDLKEFIQPKEEEARPKVNRSTTKKGEDIISGNAKSPEAQAYESKHDEQLKLAQNLATPYPSAAAKNTIGSTISSDKGVYSVREGNNMKYWDGTNWKSTNDDCNCSGNSFTINGGGLDIRLQSDHGNIYLRKKK